MFNKIKNRYLLFSTFFLVFLFLGANFIYALEVNLGLGKNPTLAKYISFIFSWVIGIAGVLAVISFAIGAISLMVSGDNPELASSAKDRMKGSILGLVLTMASILILNTINPKLTSPSLTPLSGADGVNLIRGEEAMGAPQEWINTSTLDGFNTLKYTCLDGKGPDLLVWLFLKPGLEDGNEKLGGSIVKRITCGGQESVGGGSFGSFRWAFETPGVYYCLGGCEGDFCKGYMSGANTNSQDNIGYPFEGNVRGVRFVDEQKNQKYGVIFHKVAGLKNAGQCIEPLTAYTGPKCKPINDPASTVAADIFILNNKPETAGDGIVFYSEPFGWNTGAKAGKNQTTPEEFRDGEYVTKIPNSMGYSYDDATITESYKKKCANFEKCPGSIRIKGKYLVALYNNKLCQTFRKDVPNLNVQSIKYSSGDSNFVYMIPIK